MIAHSSILRAYIVKGSAAQEVQRVRQPIGRIRSFALLGLWRWVSFCIGNLSIAALNRMGKDDLNRIFDAPSKLSMIATPELALPPLDESLWLLVQFS